MIAVVIVSANAEWDSIKSFCSGVEFKQSPFGEWFDANLSDRSVRFFHGGWGKISASASTQFVIDHFRPDLIVNLGTCGGFEGRVERGTVILVERTAVYDIHEQMTDGSEENAFYSTALDLSFLPRILPAPVLRGLLLSADRDIVVKDIPGLIKEYDAIAADWESGAIAWTARKNGAHVLILRGVSDLVGEAGGEAYGDYELFRQRTTEIMRKLYEQLPDWLTAIEKVQQGYRGF